jgi:hypothetical protein
MITYTDFKSKIYESINLLDSFIYHDKRIAISSDLCVTIDSLPIGDKFSSLEEAVEYAKNHIDNQNISNDADVISETKVVEIIKKHEVTNKITNVLVEAYVEFVNSRDFSIDPVVTELKSKFNNSQFNKLEYVLKDGTTIALDEQTVEKLSSELKDKYKLVEHMCESKENFMQVIRQLEE